MALTHVVDTSVLTRLRHQEVRQALEPRATAGRVARAGISDLEVGFSARNQSEWDRLVTALGAFPLIAAEQSGLVVLHYDADFDLISRVTGQPCEWVVPPGTVD